MEKLITFKNDLESELTSKNKRFEELKKEYIEFVQDADADKFLNQNKYTIHDRIFEITQDIETLKAQLRTINYSIKLLKEAE
jgi:predicted  nucleic acid-binding Zn-ribbon protein